MSDAERSSDRNGRASSENSSRKVLGVEVSEVKNPDGSFANYAARSTRGRAVLSTGRTRLGTALRQIMGEAESKFLSARNNRGPHRNAR